MSTHNMGFYEEIIKVIPELSSYMSLVSSGTTMFRSPTTMVLILVRLNQCADFAGQTMLFAHISMINDCELSCIMRNTVFGISH